MNMYLMIGAICSVINAIIMILDHKRLASIVNKLHYYYQSEQKVCLILAIEGIGIAIVSYFLWPIVIFCRIHELICKYKKIY